MGNLAAMGGGISSCQKNRRLLVHHLSVFCCCFEASKILVSRQKIKILAGASVLDPLQELDKLVLSPNASIISFNAISMYTNIDINDSIKCISTFLAKTWDDYDCKAVKKAKENCDEK